MCPTRGRSAPAAAKPRAAPLDVPRVSESAIQRAVVSHLQHRAVAGVVWFHPANGGARSKAEAGRFRAEGVVAGIPDLALIAGGRAYFLELKAAKGRVSPAQIEVQDRLRAAGAQVAVAYGLDAALAQLAAWGLFR